MKYDQQGLIPAIVQDACTLQVLMLGYMNQAALQQTRDTGIVTFYSRSKQRLWVKGESSGNTLTLVSITEDCDQDALLIKATPSGPTCHQNTTSCFGADTAEGMGFLSYLQQVIVSKQQVTEGYTSQLFASGVKRIAQKVGEEGVEVALAATGGEREELVNEAADLCYHLLVLLVSMNCRIEAVMDVLRSRHLK